MPNLVQPDEPRAAAAAGGRLRAGLAGNPNSGKTSLFNTLTGARQHVGNYAGVTVEKVTGLCRAGQEVFELVDLPGTYSLTAYSEEERVARDFLIRDRPDVVIDVVDASNLERNLSVGTKCGSRGLDGSTRRIAHHSEFGIPYPSPLAFSAYWRFNPSAIATSR